MYVIGQLYNHVGNLRKCRECVERSLEVYEKELGREHSTTVEVKHYFKTLLAGMEQRDDTSGSGAATRAPTGRRGSVMLG